MPFDIAITKATNPDVVEREFASTVNQAYRLYDTACALAKPGDTVTLTQVIPQPDTQTPLVLVIDSYAPDPAHE